jgi:hypothetical protein
MKSLIIRVTFILSILFFASCGHSTDVVESGIYTGKIIEVEADKSEIYVETEDGQVLELYFIEETKLTQNGEVVPFETLKEDQNVEVEIKKVGKRLDPLRVKIQ